MKLSFILLFAAILLFSCSHGHHEEAAHQEEHATNVGLALNGEERWQADEATNTNIKQLQQLMQEHLSQPDADSIVVMNELGQTMQTGFDKVFSDCRMKGPEHDMLHVYLVPMLDDVKALKTTDVETAIAARDRLASRLDQYQIYFK